MRRRAPSRIRSLLPSPSRSPPTRAQTSASSAGRASDRRPSPSNHLHARHAEAHILSFEIEIAEPAMQSRAIIGRRDEKESPAAGTDELRAARAAIIRDLDALFDDLARHRVRRRRELQLVMAIQDVADVLARAHAPDKLFDLVHRFYVLLLALRAKDVLRFSFGARPPKLERVDALDLRSRNRKLIHAIGPRTAVEGLDAAEGRDHVVLPSRVGIDVVLVAMRDDRKRTCTVAPARERRDRSHERHHEGATRAEPDVRRNVGHGVELETLEAGERAAKKRMLEILRVVDDLVFLVRNANLLVPFAMLEHDGDVAIDRHREESRAVLGRVPREIGAAAGKRNAKRSSSDNHRGPMSSSAVFCMASIVISRLVASERSIVTSSLPVVPIDWIVGFGKSTTGCRSFVWST